MQADTGYRLHLQINYFKWIITVSILIIFFITFLINCFVFSSKLKCIHILIPMHILLILFKYMSYMRTFLTIFNNYFPLIILNAKIDSYFFSNFKFFHLKYLLIEFFSNGNDTCSLLLSFHSSYLTSPTFRIGLCKILLFKIMF